MMKRSIIGEGSYGKVYKTIHKHTEVALKRIETTDEPEITEPIIMSSFKHPNLNTAIEVKNTGKSIYVYQDLAHYDLEKYYTTFKMSRVTLDRWTSQMIQAIMFLHRHNIVHADIKASNFLIFGETIKLADFTLSCVVSPEPEEEVIDYTVLDRPDYKTICTSTHRAPEIWLKRKWNKAVDIWGYGCVLFELLFKEHVFPHRHFGNESKEIQTENILEMFRLFFSDRKQYSVKYHREQHWDSKDPYLDLINKCLVFNPRNRNKFVVSQYTQQGSKVYYNAATESLPLKDRVYEQCHSLKIPETLKRRACELIQSRLEQKEYSPTTEEARAQSTILRKLNYCLDL